MKIELVGGSRDGECHVIEDGLTTYVMREVTAPPSIARPLPSMAELVPYRDLIYRWNGTLSKEGFARFCLVR